MNIYCFSTLSFAKLQFKSVINKAFHKHGVASFTDAWIETTKAHNKNPAKRVASFTDAWIETRTRRANSSHSSRIFYRCVDWNSNLKGNSALYPSRIFYRCVDWNAILSLILLPKLSSHLLQMRGLKPGIGSVTARQIMSHLLQMRGLKHPTHRAVRHPNSRIFYRCVDWNKRKFNTIIGIRVASFTDAWIETMAVGVPIIGPASHLLQMRGLKHPT